MKDIPVLIAKGRTLAEAHEDALVRLHVNGTCIPTQYDKPNDPPSIDATMNITVYEPLADPMIHKAFPGGIEDLREYVMELQGLKDHWLKNINDPLDHRWLYTYHGRFADWGTFYSKDGSDVRHKRNYKWDYDENAYGVNQIKIVIDKLVEERYTRRAQMITWMPFMDNDADDAPCVQSAHYRITEDEGIWYLNTNIRIRSNDAYGASFMNMFGFIWFSKLEIADKIAEKSNREVKLGRLNWHADSYHIYGKDIADFRKRFIDRLDKPFDTRVYNFYDPKIQAIYNAATDTILKKVEKYDKDHKD